MKTKNSRSTSTPSPKARLGNRNAAKPPGERLVALSTRVSPATLALLKRHAGRSPLRFAVEQAAQLLEQRYRALGGR